MIVKLDSPFGISNSNGFSAMIVVSVSIVISSRICFFIFLLGVLFR